MKQLDKQWPSPLPCHLLHLSLYAQFSDIMAYFGKVMQVIKSVPLNFLANYS